MAKLLKLRRGTTTQHASFTGAEGEVTIDTTKDTAVVHDGSQAGGRPLAREDMSNVSSASIAGRLGNDSIATDKIAAGNLPSDVKIVTQNIIDGTIVNADISNNAAIDGTKISPDFGTQDVVTTGNIDLSDSTGSGNNRIKIGTGDDFQMYHDGVNSLTFFDTQVGGTRFRTNVGSSARSNIILGTGVDLYYDNSKKLETFASGLQVTGRIEIPDGSGYGLRIGDSSDLQIYHDGTHSHINNGTGNLVISDTDGDIYIQAKATEQSIIAKADGAVELYHDNAKRLETTADGVTVSGNKLEVGTCRIFTNGNILLADSDELRFGTGEDLKIYHDGSQSYITNSTSDLRIRSGYLKLQGANGENMLVGNQNGTVELYYDNSKKFETFTSGTKHYGQVYLPSAGDSVQWTGSNSNAFLAGMTSGADSPSGSDEHLQFHHWNGSAWEKTFYVQRHNITLPDGNKAQFGDSADLQIYHHANENWIKADNGVVNVLLDNWIQFKNKADNEQLFRAQPNGAFEAYYDNSKKLETTSQGIKIPANGDIRIDGGGWTGEFNGGIKIQPDASNSYFQYIGTLSFRNTGGGNKVTIDQSGNIVADGNVTAYSDARLKTDIHTINDALGICGKLRGVSYKWIADGKPSIGVIAQEVEEVLPELVLTNQDVNPATQEITELKSVDYGKIVGVLINAINELKAEVDELKGGK